MHKIDTPEAINGLFDNGDPAVPRLATYVDAQWMNAVQQEIVNVILAAGITLNKASWTQLLDALFKLLADAIDAHMVDPDAHDQYAPVVHAHDDMYVRHDASQGLDLAHQAQARSNIAVPSLPFMSFCGQC